ncbi:hypothetical protein [Klebsiella oxytoca]|uniref:hypothetical protein n=1 Tax=Klebsiella oxytoca TaxID=571 RepID=UPI0039905505
MRSKKCAVYLEGHNGACLLRDWCYRIYPRPEFTSSLTAWFLNMRLFFATTTELWWLEISNADRTVTLSQICLRPGVWHGLSGKLPGYAGAERLVLLVLDQMKNLETLTLLMGALAFSFTTNWRVIKWGNSGSDLLNHFRLKSWVYYWLWWWGSRWVRLSFGTGLNTGWNYYGGSCGAFS